MITRLEDESDAFRNWIRTIQSPESVQVGLSKGLIIHKCRRFLKELPTNPQIPQRIIHHEGPQVGALSPNPSPSMKIVPYILVPSVTTRTSVFGLSSLPSNAPNPVVS